MRGGKICEKFVEVEHIKICKIMKKYQSMWNANAQKSAEC